MNRRDQQNPFTIESAPRGHPASVIVHIFILAIVGLLAAGCDADSEPVSIPATESLPAVLPPSPLITPASAGQSLSPLASPTPGQPLSPLSLPPADAAHPGQPDALTEKCQELNGLLFVVSEPGQQDNRNSQLHYWSGSNTATLSEAGTTNRLSPNYTYLAYTSPWLDRDTLYIHNVTCGPEARLYALDGDVFRTLPSTEALQSILPEAANQINLYQFEWLPDSAGLIFNTQLGRSNYFNPGAPTNDLYRFDLATGEITLLFPSAEGGVFEFSPDRQWIAVRSPNRVRLLATDTLQIVNELNHHQIRGSGYVSGIDSLPYSPFIWLEDDSGVAVVVPPHEGWWPPPEDIGGLTQVWRIPFDGAPAEGILELEYRHEQRFFLVSPDLEHVVYPAEMGVRRLAYGLPFLRREPVGSLGRYIPTTAMRHLRLSDGRETILGEWGNVFIYDWLPNQASFLLSMSDLTPRCTPSSAWRCSISDFLFGEPTPPLRVYVVDLEPSADQDRMSPLLHSGAFGSWTFQGQVDERSYLYTKSQSQTGLNKEIWLGSVDEEPTKLYDLYEPFYTVHSTIGDVWLVPAENN